MVYCFGMFLNYAELKWQVANGRAGGEAAPRQSERERERGRERWRASETETKAQSDSSVGGLTHWNFEYFLFAVAGHAPLADSPLFSALRQPGA